MTGGEDYGPEDYVIPDDKRLHQWRNKTGGKQREGILKSRLLSDSLALSPTLSLSLWVGILLLLLCPHICTLPGSLLSPLACGPDTVLPCRSLSSPFNSTCKASHCTSAQLKAKQRERNHSRLRHFPLRTQMQLRALTIKTGHKQQSRAISVCLRYYSYVTTVTLLQLRSWFVFIKSGYVTAGMDWVWFHEVSLCYCRNLLGWFHEVWSLPFTLCLCLAHYIHVMQSQFKEICQYLRDACGILFLGTES